LADNITSFAGSMTSVYVHVAFFGAWFLLNLRVLPGVTPFDPFPFVMLAMWASVEAIFLSTFVLISQNRQSEIDEQRNELDLQINLLAEHEVTLLIRMVEALSGRTGERFQDSSRELKQEVDPKAVLQLISEAERRKERS